SNQPVRPKSPADMSMDELYRHYLMRQMKDQEERRKTDRTRLLMGLAGGMGEERGPLGLPRSLGSRLAGAVGAGSQALGQTRRENVAQTQALLGDIMKGRQFAEEQWKARLPTWSPSAGGKDFFGNPIPGWVSPWNAPAEAQFNGQKPADIPGSGVPAAA